MVDFAFPDVDVHWHPLLLLFIIPPQMALAEGDFHIERSIRNDHFGVALDCELQGLVELHELHFFPFFRVCSKTVFESHGNHIKNRF